VEDGVENYLQALAKEQAEEQGQEVIIEEQAREQKKIEEVGVEWRVEMESASNAFAEHGDVQYDDVECLDTDVQALEDGSANFIGPLLRMKCSYNHSHLQSKHWVYLKPLKQQRGDDDGRGGAKNMLVTFSLTVTEIPLVDEDTERELFSLLGDWYEPESIESLFSSMPSDAVFFSS